MSNFCLSRKVILVEENRPRIIGNLKHKYRIFALTMIEIEGFGNVKSIEKWLHNELKSLKIEFSLE